MLGEIDALRLTLHGHFASMIEISVGILLELVASSALGKQPQNRTNLSNCTVHKVTLY